MLTVSLENLKRKKINQVGQGQLNTQCNTKDVFFFNKKHYLHLFYCQSLKAHVHQGDVYLMCVYIWKTHQIDISLMYVCFQGLTVKQM